MSEILNKDAALSYMFAGNAVLTVENAATGNRFTFKVVHVARATQDESKKDVALWFVKVLTGADNVNSYSFAGSVRLNGTYAYKHSTKAKIGEEAPSVKAFRWLLEHLAAKTLPEGVNIYHEGRCGRCGRRLTVPESILSGYGPECAGLVGTKIDVTV